MAVLGLTANGRDSTVVLVEGGRILAAVQEQRFTRRKTEPGLPVQSLAYARSMGAAIEAVAMPGQAADLSALGLPQPQVVDEHHAHAASAFLPSPFAEAAVLVIDRQVSLWRGDGVTLTRLRDLGPGPADFYTAITAHCGFRPKSGEYKLMGLAPYGRPHLSGDLLAQVPARQADQPMTDAHRDLAASAQAMLEGQVLDLVRQAVAITGSRHLCLAGEVALNCVANARILEAGLVEDLWIQPASGEAGAALGAALAVAGFRVEMEGARLGPCFSDEEVAQRLSAIGARFEILPEDAMLAATAQAIAAGSPVGWMQGRMEFGPRALGCRSILADPRRADMQARLNAAVKYREGFRPFAPAVLEEAAPDWFALDRPSPYMLLVTQVRRATIPAVTHVDGSARLQTVGPDNARFHGLLRQFEALTGCPVLVNTSFNVRGEPVVCSPEDAFRCFMGSDLDLLAAGRCILKKEAQDPRLRLDYSNAFPPD